MLWRGMSRAQLILAGRWCQIPSISCNGRRCKHRCVRCGAPFLVSVWSMFMLMNPCIASRMSTTAPSGEIQISPSTFALIRSRIKGPSSIPPTSTVAVPMQPAAASPPKMKGDEQHFDGEFECESRGEIAVKGKGMMNVYLVKAFLGKRDLPGRRRLLVFSHQCLSVLPLVF